MKLKKIRSLSFTKYKLVLYLYLAIDFNAKFPIEERRCKFLRFINAKVKEEKNKCRPVLTNGNNLCGFT